jgi:threonine/homoserine/homoserine lactone efflux protein
MKNSIFVKGLLTGLILQLAIGPVFIYILNIAFQGGIIHGLFAVIGVTIADYLYIIMAIIGIGKIIENNKYKYPLSVISSLVLAVFGILLIRKGITFINLDHKTGIIETSYIKSFASAFILTIASPLTIVFWASIFTSKTQEYSLKKNELFVFGLSAGLSTFLFLGLSVSVFSIFNYLIPSLVFQILNIIVGFILIYYGTTRVYKTFKNGV